MVLDIDEFLVLLSDFREGGELTDHAVCLLQLGTKMADLFLIHFDDLMQVLKLSLHRQMRMLFRIIRKFLNQFINLIDFLLVLLLLEQKGMLFEQKQVHSVQPLEVLV